jgi:hypothetical protein
VFYTGIQKELHSLTHYLTHLAGQRPIDQGAAVGGSSHRPTNSLVQEPGEGWQGVALGCGC